MHKAHLAKLSRQQQVSGFAATLGEVIPSPHRRGMRYLAAPESSWPSRRDKDDNLREGGRPTEGLGLQEQCQAAPRQNQAWCRVEADSGVSEEDRAPPDRWSRLQGRLRVGGGGKTRSQSVLN